MFSFDSILVTSKKEKQQIKTTSITIANPESQENVLDKEIIYL